MSRSPRTRLRRVATSAVSLAALLGGALTAVGAAAPASAAVPPGDEQGVTLRVFQTPYELEEICEIKAGSTPNVDTLMPTINWTTAEQFGAEDRFVAHVLANLSIEQAGSYEFQLTSDDGSELFLDDDLVIDHDGLHGATAKEGSKELTAGVHDLRINYFEATNGQELTLRWRPPGATDFTIVPESVLSTEADVVRVTAPGNKECEGELDSPGDGLQLDAVNPAFDLVDLRPEGFEPDVSGLAWDGEDLLALTWGGTDNVTGELYRLEGAQGADGPEDVTATKIAGDLREPMGVAVVDGEVFVSEKHQLSKLVDADSDGVFEDTEAFATWPYGGNFHEFAFGLLHRDGKFHLNLSVAINYGGNTTNPQPAEDRGTAITVDDETGEVTYVAGGLRTPNGIGFGPEDGVFVTDNQGGWLPASKLVQVKPGRFFQHPTNPAGRFDDEPVTKPVLWMPQNEIANSPSTPVMIEQGPFAGQMWIGDVTYGGVQRAFLEKVDGEYQGALFRSSQGLEAGVNRLLLGDDGTIYTGGLHGGGNWGQPGKLDHGLQKLVPNGSTPFEMTSMEVVEGGFEVSYTEPLSDETLASLEDAYQLEQWTYRPSEQYGGPKVAEETLDVTSAVASEDRTSVTLQVPGLRPDRVVHLRSPRPFSSESGQGLWSTEAWYTLNSYPGYVAPPPPGGLYELEDQDLEGTAAVQTEHAGFSGGGYVGGITTAGAGVTTTVTADAAGTHDLALRYSNGPNPFQGPKTMTVEVNGTAEQVTLPSSGTWQSYRTFRDTVELDAGENTIRVAWTDGDDGNVNLDFLKIVPDGGIVHEAEEGVLANGAVLDVEHAGFTGAGYVGGTWNAGASTRMTVHAAEDGDHPATLRFANGPNPFAGPKTMSLLVNDEDQGRITLPSTGTWKDWSTTDLVLPLSAGDNTVEIAYGEGDDGNVNLDHLAVRPPEARDCSAVGPDDTFEGDALDRCRWTTVLREQRSAYRVADGALEVDALAGDLSGSNPDARNVILQNAPTDGSWTAETTVSLDGTDDYLQAGLVAHAANNSYGKVVLMRTPEGAWTVELARVNGEQFTYTGSGALPADANTDLRLRLGVDEGRLTGAYSLDDGATWATVGTGYSASGLGTPMVGLAAYNGTGAETATFDDFTIGEPEEVPETCTPSTPEAGYEMLYDGTRASLDDWEMADGGSFLRQPDCSILSDGAFGLLWHTDPIDHDYSLKLDWMMPGDDNSGVFVGFPDPQGSSGPPIEQGHEVQIDATDADDRTTGAIYAFQSADLEARDAALNPVGEWNAYEIVVEGDRIRVYLNDVLVNDFTDTDPNRMLKPSHVGLQTHGAEDQVYFRDVQIKDLDAEPEPEPQPEPRDPRMVVSPRLLDATPNRQRAAFDAECRAGVSAAGEAVPCRTTVRLRANNRFLGSGTVNLAPRGSRQAYLRLSDRARTVLGNRTQTWATMIVTVQGGDTTRTRVRLTR